MFVILLIFISQVDDFESLAIVDPYSIPRYRYHIPYELPEDLDPELRQRVEEMTNREVLPYRENLLDVYDTFAYEVALVNKTYELNRVGSFHQAKAAPSAYLRFSKQDSVPLPYGGVLRAYLLYNLADAIYYTAFDKFGDLRNIPVRRNARELYKQIVERYPESYVTVFAELSIAWGLMEDVDAAAVDSFADIFNSTSVTDARILAGYGKAISHRFRWELDSAYIWFADEKWFEKNLKIVTDSTRITDELTYSELASELIDRLLMWKAYSAQAGEWYGNALDIFIHITEAYPERETAADSYLKIIEYYLRAHELEKAEESVGMLGKRAQIYPELYQGSYLSALDWMFGEYLYLWENYDKAEEYAMLYYEESGDCENIEELYFAKVLELRDTVKITELKDMIARIDSCNPRSQYLIESLYYLICLLSQQEEWEEVKETALELLTWDDPGDVRDYESDVEYLYGKAYYESGDYNEAARVFEDWVDTYTRGDYVRFDTAPYVYWSLALTYHGLAESEELGSRIKYYIKSKRRLEIIVNEYSESEFYMDKETEIENLINDCEARIRER
ncbi:outer membrane protein assembly factor BamD [candidate division WOR-3 bacterium]|uniref:Outer membrane protein assembly factor BamD n=1 Tax=candidate division WOR-3 bacterium TaxID=2052148 RepID=A0A9D5K8F8_UNCW3|nr:outer membrane protein assembly factor BamD [candidate division WOR-3 bacterium]MBD3364252.1 outer membrane protein assembly factor BamD [candidate division WOR-3 bacterium]